MTHALNISIKLALGVIVLAGILTACASQPQYDRNIYLGVEKTLN